MGWRPTDAWSRGRTHHPPHTHCFTRCSIFYICTPGHTLPVELLGAKGLLQYLTPLFGYTDVPLLRIHSKLLRDITGWLPRDSKEDANWKGHTDSELTSATQEWYPLDTRGRSTKMAPWHTAAIKKAHCMLEFPDENVIMPPHKPMVFPYLEMCVQFCFFHGNQKGQWRSTTEWVRHLCPEKTLAKWGCG